MDNSIQTALAEDGTATVVVQGEVDFSNADELAESIRAVVSEWSPALVCVDLFDATFIDSTGLGALIEGYRATTGAEAGFVVTNPSPIFHKVLVITGLCELFGLAEGESIVSTSATGTASATGA